MVTKLKFKGEKHKKRKRTDADDAQASRDGADDSEGWVNAQSLDDVGSGPLFIVFASSSPTALAYNTSGTVSASVVKSIGEDGSVDNAEPDSVPQVWIATRLAQSDKISIKTHDSKFLSCDKVGLLSASKEAIGAQEEWRPIQTNDGWALQNVYDKFLSVDEVGAGGKVEIRGDADSVGFNETFTLRIQARLRKKPKTGSSSRNEEKLSRRDLEKIAGQPLTDEQAKMLRQAMKEGRMAGALLDIRTKSKSDKYA